MRYASLSLFLLLFGCVNTPVHHPSSIPVTQSSCAAAEQNMQKLNCDNGRGGHLGDNTLKGKSWVQLCLDDASNGVDLQPDCITKAASCDEVNACAQ